MISFLAFKDYFLAPIAWRQLLISYTASLIRRKTNNRVLSYFWLILEPVAVVMMMSLIFPLIFSSKTSDYAQYLLSGLLVWNFISACLERGSQSIRSKKKLLLHTKVPIYVFNAATVLEQIFYMSITVTVLQIMAFVIGNVVLNAHILLYAYILLGLSAYSILYLLGLFALYIPDVQNLVTLLVRGLFFLTPIIYPLSRIPAEYSALMEFNPVHQYIRIFRYGVYYPDSPSTYELIMPLCITLGLMIVSLTLGGLVGKGFMKRLE